eukprot:763142-Hanusia_phi.AAC.1
MDLALSYVHGNFTFGLSTSVDGEFSKGPNLTMSNSVTSVKWCSAGAGAGAGAAGAGAGAGA